jgi:hypothetical protein
MLYLTKLLVKYIYKSKYKVKIFIYIIMSDLQDKIVESEEHINDVNVNKKQNDENKETLVVSEKKDIEDNVEDDDIKETLESEEKTIEDDVGETLESEEKNNEDNVGETLETEEHKNEDNVGETLESEEKNIEDNVGETLESEEKHDEDEEDIDSPTLEEQTKIDSIQKVSFVQSKIEEPKPEKKSFNFWSIFGFNFNSNNVSSALGAIGSRPNAPFDIQRGLGFKKVVTINNISGKNAYLILTPAPIKNVKKVITGASVGGVGASVDVDFEDKGEYKAQKISIANNTRSEYDLDNNQFYCTLFLNIDDEWKKIWDNRRFNGRKYDINILERHVNAALKKDNIPNF